MSPACGRDGDRRSVERSAVGLTGCGVRTGRAAVQVREERLAGEVMRPE